MLKDHYYIEPSEIDRLVFEKLIPADHLLRQVKERIDFEAMRAEVRACYSPDQGRPAEDPVRMLKLEYLQFQYNLSDREVLRQVQVNVAFRFFLDLSIDSPLPTVGLLSQFRTRLGEDRHRRIFAVVLTQARQAGLVKDRLRLKDATHILANIAVPNTLQLVAQARDHLLHSAQPYAPERVAQEEAEAERIRTWSADLPDAERLQARVEHLRRIVPWGDALSATLGAVQTGDRERERFESALAIAHRILEQGDHPQEGDKLRSVVDPEARRSKHGEFYDGYQFDLLVDADSGLITELDTPPANQDEAADALTLIEREERTYHNDVEALSMDGTGFQGAVLRALTAATGPNLVVYVPPQNWAGHVGPYFHPPEFPLTADGLGVTCPGGYTSHTRMRNKKDTGWQYIFKASQCQECPLRSDCMAAPPTQKGRIVQKSDYEAEYQAARQLAQTPLYAQVRKEHPRVERKFAEVMGKHGGRRTRYRGRKRVVIQYLLTAMVVNIKRMLKLLGESHASPPAAIPV